MAYITYQQYVEIYGVPPISEEDFQVYAGIASDLIDSITRYRIVRGGGISALSPFLQDAVQKATAAQVFYMAENGMESVITGQTGQGFTVGKVRVDGASNGSRSGNTEAQRMIGPMVLAMLEQTGLMGREVACLGPYQDSYFGIL